MLHFHVEPADGGQVEITVRDEETRLARVVCDDTLPAAAEALSTAVGIADAFAAAAS